MNVGETEILWRLGVALAIGLLIGFERGWRDREQADDEPDAGFRTCAVIGLVGGVSALLSESFGGIVMAAAALIIGAMLLIGYWNTVRSRGSIGATTLVAIVAAFLLGALAGVGHMGPAGAVAVVITLLLGHKPEMHDLVAKFDRTELLATLRLLLVSVVVLPLLPDEDMGPWGSLNPYRIWLLVVLIAGLSYVGYFAMRAVGSQRGLLITGLLGGLASSTAIAVHLSRLSRQQARAAPLLAAATVLAATVMFPRLLIIVGALAPQLVLPLLIPFVPAVAAGGIAVYVLSRRDGAADRTASVDPGNPLNLRMAIQFGLLLAALSVLTQAAEAWLGRGGLLAVAALSGLANLDAITLSLTAGSMAGRVGDGTIVLALTLAAGVNTAAKAGIALALGDRRMSVMTSAGLAGIFVAGGLAAAFIRF